MSYKCIDLHGMAVAYEAETSHESNHGIAGGCYRCFGPSMPGCWQRNPILAAVNLQFFFFPGMRMFPEVEFHATMFRRVFYSSRLQEEEDEPSSIIEVMATRKMDS